jgi:hypothetical protein
VSRDLFALLQIFRFGNANENRLKGVLLVWHVVMWSIWKVGNYSIFSSKVVDIDEVFAGTGMIAWKWLTARKKGGVCSFYE